MERMYVKPNKGKTVKDPRDNRPIPEKGVWVPAEQHWFRRLKAGDVVHADPPKETASGKKGE